jgi:hypothetical protein
MANCPTWKEFTEIDMSIPTNLPLVELYKANKKLCTIIALGQGKSHVLPCWGRPNMMIFPMV